MKTKYIFGLLAVFAFAFAFEANAGPLRLALGEARVFQFSETDPKYLQALSIAAAQEAQEEVDVEKKLELDEDLKPEDFGLTDIGILPTNPFYFVKDIRRGVGSLFTRDPGKKAELKLRYAAEKLLEAKKVAQKEGASDEDKEYAIENFRHELDEVKHRIGIASEALDDEKAIELSKKVLDATFKYGKSLGNIEKNVSPELFDFVKKAKDASSEALASTFKLAEPEVVSNQLVEVLDKQGGSEFKDFKNLEVLKEVEGKVSENAKEAIKTAQDNALNRLQAELEKFEATKNSIFEEFVKESGGSEIRHLEIINELEARPISKGLREVISDAKEHVFSKAETRLNGLSQENKERFVEHLGEGNLEDFRILRELQNNIDSGVVSGISNVASRAEEEFVKKIESTGQNETQKREFLGSIERFHDAKSISVLNEIEKLIPNDKKNIFAELKNKAAQEIRNDVNRAANSSQRQYVYDALAGDHPEEFAALDEFGSDVNAPFDISSFIERIKSAQYGIMQNKIENITDKDRLAKYEKEFRNDVPDYASFRRVFEQRRVIFDSPEKALKKIEEAEKALAEFRGVRSSLPYDTAYKGGEFDQMLRDIEGILAHAERKLETARTVLSYDDIGRAFGEAQSAENIARDGIALAQKYKSGVKETKCPFYYPPSSNFCPNGVVIHQTDQNGCPLPPRCEIRESQECPFINYSAQSACPSGTHREAFKDEKGCYALGKCVPDRVTCQAYFEGYVFDKLANSCKKESSSGCSDPFTYRTLDECTKAHSRVNVCPALPTVESCPAGERKIITYSSPECGVYYGCEKDTTTGKNWIEHIWNFIDGTERSMILNRTDSEYTSFIKGIHSQCEKISKNRFVWKAGAGNDAPENWQNFGIPDCSGSVVACNNNGVCDANEYYNTCASDCGSAPAGSCSAKTDSASCTATSGCTWAGTYCYYGSSGGESSCNNDGKCSGSESNFSCPKDCPALGNGCYGNASKDPCVSAGCNWSPGDSVTKSYCEPLASGKYCGNGACEVGETFESCAGDCKGFTGACYAYGTESTCKSSGCTWYAKETHSDGPHCDNAAHGQTGGGGGDTSKCVYTTESTCNANTVCAWVAGFGCGARAQCNDKTDNDNDGKIDMADSGCSDNFDNDEFGGVSPILYEDSASLCSDGIDNDKDGFTDLADPSCSAFTTTGTTQCSDGKDNDGDGQVDYPADTGCYGKEDNDETIPTTTTGGGGCGTYVTSATCEANTACDWFGSSCGPTAYTGACGNHTCDTGETSASCPIDCGGSTTSCVSCPSPGTGCWYEGGSCSTCGTVKCSTTTTTTTTTCPSGQYWTGTACAINPSTTTTTCSTGQYWNGTACVANTTTTTTTTCPSGQYWTGTACAINP